MYPDLPDPLRMQRLQIPGGRLDTVIDTDTYNEIDDQFALVHALLSPQRLNVQAIYAAPFHNERSSGPGDGMQKSYQEILKLLERLGRPPASGFVFKGAQDYLPADGAPCDSPAARDLVQRALARPAGDPLYVVCIAAITNLASAILLEPSIIEKIVVVWLGGHALHWPDTAEFNLRQDVRAARLVFECGAPLVLVPCMGVASHLHTSLPEVEKYVRGRGATGDYLYEIFAAYQPEQMGRSKVIWDLAAVAFLLDPGWMSSMFIPCPVLTDELTWKIDPSRRLIRYIHHIDRDPIFRDLFTKLAQSVRTLHEI